MQLTFAATGWRRRLLVIAALPLFVALGASVVGQTSAHAAVTITVFAGNGTAGFSGDGGPATAAQLNQPEGVAADISGNVYIWDNLNQRIRVVSHSGTIRTLAGDGSPCDGSYLGNEWSYDAFGLCSSSYPVGFGAGTGGAILVNNGGWLDEVYPSGTKAHVAGGLGGSYYNPGDGSDFGVNVAPTSLAVGSAGMYFVEAGTAGWPGNSIKLWSAGSGITTIAGMSGTQTCNYYPPASSPTLPALGTCIHPQDLTVWSHYLYFFDNSPGWQGPTIWRVDLNQSSPTLTHIAGSGSNSDYGSDGSLAVNDGISSAGPIAVDANGNLFFGSSTTGALREVDTSGELWNVTNLGASQNSFAFDLSGNLYASEPDNNQVVRVTGLDHVAHKGRLVALGDSVAAGEGIGYGFIYDPTTDSWSQSGPASPNWANTKTAIGANYPGCHQTLYAYDRLLQANGYTVFNMACTSATVKSEPAIKGYTDGGILVREVLPDGTSPPAQLGGNCSGCDPPNQVFDNHKPTVVTLTVGADDIDFADWIVACYGGTSACNTTSNQTLLSSQLSKAQADLRMALTELNRRAGLMGYNSSHRLKVLVTNYYDPYQSTYAQCADTSGGPLLSTYPWIGITGDEQAFIVNGLLDLNGNINTEVNYAKTNDTNLKPALVDLSSVISGHEYCTPNPWVYGPSIDYPAIGGGPITNPAPFHPTPDGQYAIYLAVLKALGSK